MNNAKTPLECRVENDQLIISIGINILAFCADNLGFCRSEEYNDIQCHDPLELAKSVVSELTREEEDGSTPVHHLLDQAIIDAWEDGADGFIYEDEDEDEDEDENI